MSPDAIIDGVMVVVVVVTIFSDNMNAHINQKNKLKVIQAFPEGQELCCEFLEKRILFHNS